MNMSLDSSSTRGADGSSGMDMAMDMGMGDEVVLTPAQGLALWPVCNNLTVHGPNSPQAPSSAIAMAAMTDHDNWYDMEKYMRNITWLLLALIGLAVLPGLLRRIRTSSPRKGARFAKAIPGYLAFAALCRRVGYTPAPSALRRLGVPHLGHLLLILAFWTGTTIWCFAIRPYYRCTREWGSPPLGVRAGMFATALVPFIFAFGTKVNIVTVLTYLSHERLQIWHQAVARLALFFSVVHTVPFVWQPLKEGGRHNLYLYFFTSGGSTYWSGVVALAILAWIVASSTRVFRSFSYEFFVIQHIISINLFLGFYFLHTENALNTWMWLWAAVGVWGLATLLRWSRAARASEYFIGCKALVEVQASQGAAIGADFVRISLSTSARWSPGQHVFVRFPTVSPLQAHPFTILTLSSPDHHAQSELVILARVHAGLTRSLHNAVLSRSPEPELGLTVLEKEAPAARSRSRNTDAESLDKSELPSTSAAEDLRTRTIRLPASIDGPYGSSGSLVASYEAVVLIAGGSGATFVLPLLSELAVRAARADTELCTRSITLLWTLREPTMLRWLALQLRAASELLIRGGVRLDVRLHFTRSSVAGLRDEQHELVYLLGPELARLTSFSSERVAVRRFVKAEVERTAATKETCGELTETIAVVVCAPSEMAEEVSAETARAQSKVLAGSLKEIYLIREAFAM